MSHKVCQFCKCGKEFSPKRKNQLYCTFQCRIKASAMRYYNKNQKYNSETINKKKFNSRRWYSENREYHLNKIKEKKRDIALEKLIGVKLN